MALTEWDGIKILWQFQKDCYRMNPIEKLQKILKEMKSNKDKYITNSQKDFTHNRKY